ncbi:hypothetical protein N0M98_06595 [Paenibacillus doosanensis]|uniref:DUF7002 family protein n=1 Tax=Paenibacillus konkukensis TaxID=2020716 RepID=UPI00201DB450|nr:MULTISPECIES: hypothetical protein [Paenibacillus]MCS7459807.1 hypothetical protein [Paenibacillus doosanensis]
MPAIAHFDALLSSRGICSSPDRERRLTAQKIMCGNYEMTINPHLKIADAMLDSDVTQEQFRDILNRHVFFWPTLQACRKMMDTYTRREPATEFAVLRLDAGAFLTDFYDRIKLSKYDSGSSPRYPNRCFYKKSAAMFLPLERFGLTDDSLVPGKPSDILEVLVEKEAAPISPYLQAVYTSRSESVPGKWKKLWRTYEELQCRS